MSFTVTNIQIGTQDTVNMWNGASEIVRNFNQVVPNTRTWILRNVLDIIVLQPAMGNGLALQDGSNTNDHFVFNATTVAQIGGRFYTPINPNDSDSAQQGIDRAIEVYNDIVQNIFKGCCTCGGGGNECSIQYQYTSDLGSGTWYMASGVLVMSVISYTSQNLASLFAMLPAGSWLSFFNEDDPTVFGIYQTSAPFVSSGYAYWTITLVDGQTTFTEGQVFCVQIAPAGSSPSDTYISPSSSIAIDGDGSVGDPYVPSIIIIPGTKPDVVYYDPATDTYFYGAAPAGGGVESVTGPMVDNTDPDNPVVNDYVVVTKAQADTLIAGDDLVLGIPYFITDLSGTDLGGILSAASENEFELQGAGIFLNPDFQSIGDYSGVSGLTGVSYTTTEDVWLAANEAGTPYSNGMVVFWNGLHYQVVNDAAFGGTDPETNTTAYQVLPKATANMGYIREVDVIQFNYAGNLIIQREDRRANKVMSSFVGGGGITRWQWGNNNVLGNSVWVTPDDDPANAFNIINQKGGIQNNVFTVCLGSEITNEFNGTVASCVVQIVEPFQPIGVESIGNKTMLSTGSSFERITDITGMTTLTVVNGTFCGLQQVTSSNATETIDNITGAYPGTFPFRLFPSAGLTLTVTGTAWAAINANGQILMPTVDIELDGDYREDITFQSVQIVNGNGSFGVLKQVDANTYL